MWTAKCHDLSAVEFLAHLPIVRPTPIRWEFKMLSVTSLPPFYYHLHWWAAMFVWKATMPIPSTKDGRAKNRIPCPRRGCRRERKVGNLVSGKAFRYAHVTYIGQNPASPPEGPARSMLGKHHRILSLPRHTPFKTYALGWSLLLYRNT